MTTAAESTVRSQADTKPTRGRALSSQICWLARTSSGTMKNQPKTPKTGLSHIACGPLATAKNVAAPVRWQTIVSEQV